MSRPEPAQARRAAAALLGAIAAAGLLAGCAGGPAPRPPATPPPAAVPQAGPALGLEIPAPPSIARRRVEALAAACWLDAELAAEAMVVDRQTGAIIATGASGELLRVAFAPAGPLATAVRLTGPALDDAARAGRMRDALARVLEGPQPAC